jgi:hypothetical protein
MGFHKAHHVSTCAAAAPHSSVPAAVAVDMAAWIVWRRVAFNPATRSAACIGLLVAHPGFAGPINLPPGFGFSKPPRLHVLGERQGAAVACLCADMDMAACASPSTFLDVWDVRVGRSEAPLHGPRVSLLESNVADDTVNALAAAVKDAREPAWWVATSFARRRPVALTHEGVPGLLAAAGAALTVTSGLGDVLCGGNVRVHVRLPGVARASPVEVVVRGLESLPMWPEPAVVFDRLVEAVGGADAFEELLEAAGVHERAARRHHAQLLSCATPAPAVSSTEHVLHRTVTSAGATAVAVPTADLRAVNCLSLPWTDALYKVPRSLRPGAPPVIVFDDSRNSVLYRIDDAPCDPGLVDEAPFDDAPYAEAPYFDTQQHAVTPPVDNLPLLDINNPGETGSDGEGDDGDGGDGDYGEGDDGASDDSDWSSDSSGGCGCTSEGVSRDEDDDAGIEEFRHASCRGSLVPEARSRLIFAQRSSMSRQPPHDGNNLLESRRALSTHAVSALRACVRSAELYHGYGRGVYLTADYVVYTGAVPDVFCGAATQIALRALDPSAEAVAAVTRRDDESVFIAQFGTGKLKRACAGVGDACSHRARLDVTFRYRTQVTMVCPQIAGVADVHAYKFLVCFGARVRFVRVLTPGTYTIQAWDARVRGGWVSWDSVRIRGASDTHAGDVFDLTPLFDADIDAPDAAADGIEAEGSAGGSSGGCAGAGRPLHAAGGDDNFGPKHGLCTWQWATGPAARARTPYPAPQAPPGKRIRRMVPRFRIVAVCLAGGAPPPPAIRATFVGTAVFDARIDGHGFTYSSRVCSEHVLESGVTW